MKEIAHNIHHDKSISVSNILLWIIAYIQLQEKVPLKKFWGNVEWIPLYCMHIELDSAVVKSRKALCIGIFFKSTFF